RKRVATTSRWASGSTRESCGASSAATVIIARRISPIRPRVPRQSGKRSDRGMANSGIDGGHQEFGQKISDNYEYRADGGRRHDDWIVPGEHGLHQQLSDARPAEDRFHEHRTRKDRWQ